MAQERRFAGWQWEAVVSAVVAGAVAVVVAFLAVTDGSRAGGDDGGSGALGTSPESRPLIFVNETEFGFGSTGRTVIRVVGSALAFRPGDRLYAIAKPPARRSWWISDPIIPVGSGNWVAVIEVAPGAGEQMIISAVRIPAEKYEEPGSTPELMEIELRARGDNALAVDGWSNSMAVIAPAR